MCKLEAQTEAYMWSEPLVYKFSIVVLLEKQHDGEVENIGLDKETQNHDKENHCKNLRYSLGRTSLQRQSKLLSFADRLWNKFHFAWWKLKKLMIF